MREPLPEFPQFSSDFPLIFRRQKTITLQWCYVRVSQVSSVRPCESAAAPARLNVSVLMNFHFQQTLIQFPSIKSQPKAEINLPHVKC